MLVLIISIQKQLVPEMMSFLPARFVDFTTFDDRLQLTGPLNLLGETPIAYFPVPKNT